MSWANNRTNRHLIFLAQWLLKLQTQIEPIITDLRTVDLRQGIHITRTTSCHAAFNGSPKISKVKTNRQRFSNLASSTHEELIITARADMSGTDHSRHFLK